MARRAGSLPSAAAARRFCDVLLSRGIDAHHAADDDGGAESIWIEDETRLSEARDLLATFAAAPETSAHAADLAAAEKIRAARAAEAARAAKLQRDARSLFRNPLRGGGPAPLTWALIGLSIFVAVTTRAGKDFTMLGDIFFIAPPYPPRNDLAGLVWILNGQVWRLLTPIFIHFGILHILFNMLWLRDLAAPLEHRYGALGLALLVVLIAVPSNLAQYFYSGPSFGGMSGVVYGLLGYVFVLGRLAPSSGVALHRQTVMFMGIWLVLGMLGILGPVANAVHLVGLGMGALAGAARAVLWRR